VKRFLFFFLFLALVVGGVIVGTAITKSSTTTAATDWDPSGQAMPRGNLPGWHQVFADNFAHDSYPLGSLSGCTIRARCEGTPMLDWGAVEDGHPDTSGHCEYFPSQTVSISGGILRIYMHTDSKGVCMDASLYPLAGYLKYGRYSVRFRSQVVPGYKGVFLLWPRDDVDGEIDLPDANLNAPLKGYLHTRSGGAQQQAFGSKATWTSWHTVTLQWTPTSIVFLLDGRIIGSTDRHVPQTPMKLALRAESDLLGAPKPPATAKGNLEIDWVTIYSYVPPAG
jgi:hypothetical protein